MVHACVLCPWSKAGALCTGGDPPEDWSLEELGGESRAARFLQRGIPGPPQDEKNLRKSLRCSLPHFRGEEVGTVHVKKNQLDSKPQHGRDWGWSPCGLHPTAPPQGGRPCGSQGTQRLLSGGVGRASAGGCRPARCAEHRRLCPTLGFLSGRGPPPSSSDHEDEWRAADPWPRGQAPTCTHGDTAPERPTGGHLVPVRGDGEGRAPPHSFPLPRAAFP